jgi:hypothetical protein
MPVIPPFRKPRQENPEIKASLVYIEKNLSQKRKVCSSGTGKKGDFGGGGRGRKDSCMS